MRNDLFASRHGCSLFHNIKTSDEDFFQDRKEHVLQLWQKFQKIADSEFIDRFPYDLAQRYWEMFVGCTLIDCDLNPSQDWARRPNGDGLDFRIDGIDGKKLWVEATTCSPGDWKAPSVDDDNLVPKSENYDDILNRVVSPGEANCGGQHIRQLRLRVASKFSDKLGHISNHIFNSRGEDNEDDYYVIAIGGGEIQSRIWHDNLGSDVDILSMFTPVEDTGLINLATGPILNAQRSTNKTGSDAPIDKPFEMQGAERISGVLFSTRTIISNSYQWEDNMIWIPNYNATHKLSDEFFTNKLHSILIRIDGNRASIESRPL